MLAKTEPLSYQDRLKRLELLGLKGDRLEGTNEGNLAFISTLETRNDLLEVWAMLF